MMGALGQKMGSYLGTAKKVAPKPEQEQAAEELALGPEIAGRVLGARPLWSDAAAQQRVNVIGRWVASQTSRPDLPWTFGVIDTAEVNAFAAPGGYILVTRGLYEILASDSEVAAVLGHEISHCVQRDHYNVIRKQELTAMGQEAVSGKVQTGGSAAETYARQYAEEHGATILLTSLDRDAEFRADKAAEIYLARSGMNPMALYSVLQKMTALGEQSASLAALYKTHPPLEARLNHIDARGYEKLAAYIARE
jgi:beta-barrel assembly-enhancing protease